MYLKGMNQAARLRALAEYDPETGVFTRLRSPGRGKAKAGDRLGYLDTSRGYWRFYFDGKYAYYHRMAWLYMTGENPVEEIDHINGNREDNRWVNLRPATKTENNKNRKKHSSNKSGRKGVCWHKKSGKWIAQIGHGRSCLYLGIYDTIDAAGDVYDRAAEKLHADFNRGD